MLEMWKVKNNKQYHCKNSRRYIKIHAPRPLISIPRLFLH